MSFFERLRLRMGQWRNIAALLAVTIPLLALCALGGVWLFQNNYWLSYLAGCLALTALASLFSWASKWQRSEATSPVGSTTDRKHVAGNSDWSHAEARVFKESCARIQTATQEPVTIEDLRSLIELEMDEIAKALRGPNADMWEFSVPEGLLLTSRITTQFRGHLIEFVPFSDQLTVRHLRMGWSYSGTVLGLWRLGKSAYRGSRVIFNPVGAILSEAKDLLGNRFATELGSAGLAGLQALLLEDVARNAVDLYSGRLALDEKELADRAARATAARGDVSAPTLAPLAIVVMGQVSTGKTALIDALMGKNVGLSGAEPITDSFLCHNWDLDGVDCHLIDTPGLGQSEAADAELADWVAKADLLIWVVSANRPARAPDHAFLHGITESFSEHPELVHPKVIVAATHVDRLVGNAAWPFPEHDLPPDFLQKLEKLMAQVQADLKSFGMFVPVVVCDTPGAEWNISELRDLIHTENDHAAQTQRSRARFAQNGLGRAISKNVSRFMRLTEQGIKMSAGRTLKRAWRRFLWRRVG